MKNYLLALVAIMILGMGLRVFMLGSRPNGFTWDEAGLGYNSYSLLKTGKDEYGKPLPIILKSFGDYKPGVYAYFLVPLTGIGGLNQFTTRLPSAIFGGLGILLIFLIGMNLVSKKSGLGAALLMAVNPWAIQFSRGAWETNVNLVLTAIGVLLFLRKKYFWSVLFFGLTFWTYQGAKLFTPLLVFSLIIIYRKQIDFVLMLKRSFVILIFVLPIAVGWASQSGRLKVYSVFSYQRSASVVQEILRQDNDSRLGSHYYLFHSEILDQMRGVYGRFLNHFSLRYLFITGDWTSLRQTIPYYGYFHVVEMLFIGLGLMWGIRNINSHVKFILTWLILAVIPAAFSRDLVSGVRTLPMVVPLTILSGIGLAIIFQRRLLRIVCAGILAFLVIYYSDLYFNHAPYFSAVEWLYPYQPAVKLVGKNMADYQKIVITQKFGQPYIFVLYYLKIDPHSYQAESKLSENSQGDVGTIDKFSKFEFREVSWREDRKSLSTLFVGTQFELPEQDLVTVDNLIRIGDINFPSGDTALRVVGIP